MKFELDEDQIKKLQKWQAEIKKRHGMYGMYDYKFSPNGIGEGVEVYSHLAKKTLDLTDVSKW